MRLALLWASLTALAAVSSAAITETGECGGTTGLTCEGSRFGNCCSQYVRLVWFFARPL
ncbi:hypothetical protein AA0112_g11553 [Alternaria arborescens]|uniref:hypothetical protein n=1 Tax=Alternaria arborescens TaxID=156630 RepID=UPI0010756B1A|nr:hypothetical protein AA0111_g12520 [Alternaria arborescens]RYN18484.1 hypothetical protein AA0112_g11553 [Alternaria arborescens]RYO12581.1 hypothetical protein AA0111_g12520 [Alternaria arborescens]